MRQKAAELSGRQEPLLVKDGWIPVPGTCEVDVGSRLLRCPAECHFRQAVLLGLMAAMDVWGFCLAEDWGHHSIHPH